MKFLFFLRTGKRPSHKSYQSHSPIGSPKYGFSTLESRESRQRQRFIRKSSLPLENGGDGGAVSGNTIVNVCNNNGGSGSSHSSEPGSCASGSRSCIGETIAALHQSPSMGHRRTETFPVLLDCSHGSGIILGSQSGHAVNITQIFSDSVAARSGCIQKGDRIVSINKLYNLDVQTMRQLLDGASGTRQTPTAASNWLELEIEFDLPDTVIPSSGVFHIQLIRAGKSNLGISVTSSSHGSLIIADIQPGSPAHRTGYLRPGDILLAIDNQAVQHFNVDALLMKDASMSADFTTLTIKRVMLPDFLCETHEKLPKSPIYCNCPPPTDIRHNDHDLYNSGYVASKYTEVQYNDCTSLKSTTPQPEYFRGSSKTDNTLESVKVRHQSGPTNSSNWTATTMTTNDSTIGRSFGTQDEDEQHYSDFTGYELNRYASVDYTSLPPPMEKKVYGCSAVSSSSKSSGSSSLHQIVFTVRLEPMGRLLGITLAGSEDINKPITISAIADGGIAYSNGQIQIGDQLLAIDDCSVKGSPLSHATSILQKLDDIVDLKILRTLPFGYINDASHNMPQPQAIYVKVQRQPHSPSSTSVASGKDNSKHRNFQVTLCKDKVYDDFGFSISDGLYERGVFINRIRRGGPADMSDMLKPFDRIMQVNEIKTQDFDCCLTVPLIAAADDKIEMIIQRTD